MATVHLFLSLSPCLPLSLLPLPSLLLTMFFPSVSFQSFFSVSTEEVVVCVCEWGSILMEERVGGWDASFLDGKLGKRITLRKSPKKEKKEEKKSN